MPAHALNICVEGSLDARIVSCLLAKHGLSTNLEMIANGKGELDKRLPRYNEAAKHMPWLVVRDLDDDAPCPPALTSRLLPAPSPGMAFRIAVRAIEAWLLMDTRRLAAFLGVAESRVPRDPERVPSPKRTIVRLASASRSRAIRQAIVPRAGSGIEVGPEYGVVLAAGPWSPGDTAARWPDRSLARLWRRLEAFRASGRW